MPRWLAYAVLSAVLWGGWGVAATSAGRAGVGPHLVQALLPIGMLPIAGLLAASPAARPGSGGWAGAGWAAATGLLAGVGNVALFTAADRGSAAVVYPLAAVYPLVTIAAAVPLLGERVNRVQAAGVALALAAGVVLNLQPGDAAAAGGAGWFGFAAVAVLLFGLSGVTQKLAAGRLSNERSTLWFTAAFAALGAAMLAAYPPQRANLPAVGLYWVAAVGALNGLAVLAQFAAYKTGPAAVVTPVVTLYPVVVVLAAVPLFGERPGLVQWAGIALALAGAVCLSRESPPPIGADGTAPPPGPSHSGKEPARG